jgi:apolipoprotein N-acyltransferase
VRAAVATKAGYVVLPEGSATVPGGTPTFQAYKEFRATYEDPSQIIVESVRTPIALTEVAMRGRVYDGTERVAYNIDKQRLVPQGEFMPDFYLFVMRLLGFGEAVRTIEGKLNYRPGPYASQSGLPSQVPSILFCYAEADPLSVWRYTRERDVPFVVQPISHAWFNSPESLWHQYDAMRKIHAVWNQVSVLSAGNMTEGAWYTTVGTKLYGTRVAEGEWWSVSLVE